MKKLLLFITVILFSIAVQAQNSVKPLGSAAIAIDSVKQVEAQKEAQKIVTEIITKTPVKDFQEWLYKTMPAEQYANFFRYYDAFISLQYNQKLKAKKP